VLAQRSSTACLTEAEVEDFVFQRLSGVTREAIEEHLLYCHECLNQVEREESFVNAFRHAARELESKDLHRAYSGGPWKRIEGAWKALWGSLGGRNRWFLALGAAGLAITTVIVIPLRRGPEPTVALDLEVHRGAMQQLVAVAPADRTLRLHLDAAGLPPGPCRVEVVSDRGQRRAGGAATLSEEHVTWNSPSLAPGSYWVRLYSQPGGELLREYALRVH
jgi:anti-sigma-K factor RskA